MDDRTKKPVQVSKQALSRMPFYLDYMRTQQANGEAFVSAPMIARELNLNEVQVRKDLALVSESGGRPKTGYPVQELIRDMERFLGYTDTEDAVLVGVGALGRALLSYQGFSHYGLRIIAAFDADPNVYGATLRGTTVLPIEKLTALCSRMHIRIGIIAVPKSEAQQVCDQLCAGGILAIWNFAPVHLRVPPHVLVHNENMAASLALLSKHLKKKLLPEA